MVKRGRGSAVSAGVSPMKRRGLMAGIAAAAALAVSQATDRVRNVAYAAQDLLDVNIITFSDAGQNGFRDVHTTGNSSGLRFYNANALTVTPDGAAIQFWGNNTIFPGQAYIDAGSNNGGAVILRTAPNGAQITERMRIDSAGNTLFTGKVSIAGEKEFIMDHPLDPDSKYLHHAAVEAPEQLLVYSGNVTTDARGEAVVQLPDYFEAINKDLRYQLTVIGQFAQAIVTSKVKNNQFSIRTDKGGVEVSWQVSGVRNDIRARRNPFVTERPKDDDDKGTRIHPQDWGLPENRRLRWRKSPERLIEERERQRGPRR